MEFNKNPIDRSKGKIKALLSTGCVTLSLLACAPVVHHHGYVFDEVDLSTLKPSVTTISDVKMALGTPTITSTVEGHALYYVSSRIEAYTFYAPKETYRHVLALHFDADKKLTDFAEYGLEDGKIVAFSDRETVTSGRELSFLEQIFGNLGRFDSGDSAGPGGR